MIDLLPQKFYKKEKEGKEGDKNKEEEIKRSDLVRGQYTNACKLATN